MKRATPSVLSRMRTWVAAEDIMRLAALVAIAAFLTDWALKEWALASFTDNAAPLGSFVLAPEHNDAFAFSAGDESVSSHFVMGVRLAMLYLIGALFGRAMVRDRRSAGGVGLVLGGGIGNTADLAFRGAVVDFVNVGPYALDLGGQAMDVHLVFNTADVAILLGILLLAPHIRTWALAAQRRIAVWERRLVRARRTE